MLHFLTSWQTRLNRSHSENKTRRCVDRYAGVYVPTIARTVVRDPAGINLAGFAVGDGCMGTEVLCGHREGP